MHGANGEQLGVISLPTYTHMEFGPNGQYHSVQSILGMVCPSATHLTIYEGSKHVSTYHLHGSPPRFHFITHQVRLDKHVPLSNMPVVLPTAPLVLPSVYYDESGPEDGPDCELFS